MTHQLMLDPGDTAVTDATAEALLQRGDVAALREFAAAWRLAVGEIADHLSGTLSSFLFELSCAAAEDRERFQSALRQLAADVDPAVRDGARSLVERVTRALSD